MSGQIHDVDNLRMPVQQASQCYAFTRSPPVQHQHGRYLFPPSMPYHDTNQHWNREISIVTLVLLTRDDQLARDDQPTLAVNLSIPPLHRN